jgi:tetratricopeptide (TPR) repeat protein
MKESSDILFKKGESLIESGDYGSALTFFRQMLIIAEIEGVGSQMRNRLYNFSAIIHNRAKQLNDQIGGHIYFTAGLEELNVEIAISELLLEYEPHSADIWSGLGLAYDNLGNCEKAEKCYRQAIGLDPCGVFAADSWTNLGVLYWNYAKIIHVPDQNGNIQEIPFAGTKMSQLRPSSERMRIIIVMHRESPHRKTAELAFKQALSIYNSLAIEDTQYQRELIEVHWNCAKLYTELLEGSKAIKHVQTIHNLDPFNQKAIDWLKEAERNTGKKLL